MSDVKNKSGLIPDHYLIKCNFLSLCEIAQNQILSLLRRRELTRNYSLYNREINRVILSETNRVKEKVRLTLTSPSNLKSQKLKQTV